MSFSRRTLLRIAGACGIASVIIATVAESLAIFNAPGFSFTENWLSDLGGLGYAAFLNVPRSSVSSPTTILIGQGGLIVAGLLAIVFALGLLRQADSPACRLGAVFGIVATAGLCASGIFPAPTGRHISCPSIPLACSPRRRCSSSVARLSYRNNGWRDGRSHSVLSLWQARR